MKILHIITITYTVFAFCACDNMGKNVKVSAVHQPDIIFSKGKKISNSNFKGTTWLNPLVSDDSMNTLKVGNVTFEPGARTKWHTHPGGQILLVTGGVGYYCEKGKPGRVLHKGDVLKCPPNVPHWHGASRDTGFIQIAITDAQKGETVWLEAVSDKEYNSFSKIK